MSIYSNKEYLKLIQSGPDFFGNTWQGVFVQRKVDSPKSNIFSAYLTDVEADKKFDYSALFTRLSDFSIPTRTSEVGTINFGNRTITKTTTQVLQSRVLDLKFNLDQNLYLFDFFNNLSMSKRAGKLKAFEPINGVNQVLLDLIPAFQRVKLDTTSVNKDNSIIDLIVFYCAQAKNKPEDTKPSPTNKDNLVRIWELTDIRFLGRKNALTFDSTNANNLNITVPITYKFLYETSLNYRTDLLDI